MTLRIPFLALMACLALVAAGCGGEEDEPKRPAAASVDQAFVNRMASHADLSRQIADAGAKGAEAAAVKRLARRLAKARESETGMLRGLQQRLGGLPGGKDPLGVSPQQAAEGLRPDILRQAKPFDQVFLQLMIQHHQGALALIQAERKLGKDQPAKALAEQFGQRRAEELNELNDQLVKVQG